MQTIYYVSDLKWFGKITSDKYSSKKEMVYHHLSYIEQSKDFRFGTGNLEEILKGVDIADKRANSRVAVSFVFALPNDLEEGEIKEWIEEIRELLADFNDMKKEQIYIGYHDSTGISREKNKHLHIVLLNLNKDGKAIPLGRDRGKVRKLHKELQNYIIAKGYEIRKDKEKGAHIGVRIRHDEEAREQYLEHLRAKKELEKIEKEKEQAMVSLEYAKQHINLVELAVRKFGYRIDKKKSSKHYKTLKRDSDVIIVKKNSANNHWIYFSAGNEQDNGTIIDFLQHRGIGNLGQVRAFLKGYLEQLRSGELEQIEDFEIVATNTDEKKTEALKEFAKLEPLPERNYLTEERKISSEIVRKNSDYIYTDDRNNAVFVMHDEKGELIGLARYGRNGFKNITGKKGIWINTASFVRAKNSSKVVIGESPIDLLSYAELQDRDDLFLISTQGQISDRTIDAVYETIKRLALLKQINRLDVVFAFDNDEKGKEFAEKMKSELIKRAVKDRLMLNFEFDFPSAKDWNEELKEEKEIRIRRRKTYDFGMGR